MVKEYKGGDSMTKKMVMVTQEMLVCDVCGKEVTRDYRGIPCIICGKDICDDCNFTGGMSINTNVLVLCKSDYEKVPFKEIAKKLFPSRGY